MLTPLAKRALQEQSLNAINNKKGHTSKFLKFLAISRSFYGCFRRFQIYMLGFWYDPRIDSRLHFCFLPMHANRETFNDWKDRMMKLDSQGQAALYKFLRPHYFYVMI